MTNFDNPPATAPVDAPEHWRSFAPDLDAAKVLFSDIAPGGSHWSYVLPRGVTLRMTALEDGANISVVLYAAREKLERYNMPDSLKAQHTAHYTRGHVRWPRSRLTASAGTIRLACCSTTLACARSTASVPIRPHAMPCTVPASMVC
jgi:uncharacterized protein YcgI (DUF1989 family)